MSNRPSLIPTVLRLSLAATLSLLSVPSFAGLSFTTLIGAKGVSGPGARIKSNPTTFNRPSPVYGPGHFQFNASNRRFKPNLQSGASWPRYHGNNQSNGQALGAGTNGLLAWRVQLGGEIESSAAIAADGTVYVGCDDDKLYAVSAMGAIEWAYPTSNKVISSPAIGADGTVYVASRDGNLYAISSSGSSLWSFSLGGATNSSPAVDPTDGDIYVGGGDGNLYAVTSAGILDWKLYIDPVSPTHHEEIDQSPAIDSNGNIYIAEPSLDGIVYEIGSNGTLIASAFEGAASGNFVSSPAIDSNDNIYVAVSTANPRQIFFDNLVPGTLGSPGSGGAHDGTNATLGSPIVDIYGDMFVGTTNGILDQGNPYNGTVSGFGSLSFPITGSPAISEDGYVYYGVENGGVFVSFPGQPVTRVFQTGAPIEASMAIDANGSLFIGSTDDYLYAIGSVPQIASVTLSPSTIIGGYSTSGMVTLDAPATGNGLTVYLSNQWPGYVSVPTSVVVPSGQTTGYFPVTVPSLYSATFTDIITATDIDSTANALLTVTGEKLVSFSLNQNAIGAEGTVTGTVTVTNPAPSGGWTVNLAASTPSYVSMPTSISIPEGSTSTTFSISGAHNIISNIVCAIHATDAASGLSAQLTLLGDSVFGLTVAPTSIGGFGSTVGTVTLNLPAPAPGWTVNLSAGAPGFVSMPLSVTVPAGQDSVQFAVEGVAPHINSVVLGILANDGNTGAEALLNIGGDSVAGLTLTPGTVTRGNGSTGTVTLATPAPLGGWTVNLKVGAPSLVGVPASITIQAGQQTGTFPITTQKYGGAANVNVVATDNNTAASQLLTIE